MRLRPFLICAALIPALLFGPAAADTTAPENCRVIAVENDEELLACTERVYYKCVGDTKVQNVSIVQGQIPGWNSTAPTQSFRSGAGCGTAETLLTSSSNPRNGHDGIWEGTFTGNLDSLTMEFHKIDSTSRLDNTENLLLWVQVDGEDVVARTTSSTIEVVGERSSTGATIKYVVTITDLPYVTEVGAGTQEREVMVSARSFADYPGGWVWDAVEIPAGVTFNPATPTQYKLRAANADA